MGLCCSGGGIVLIARSSLNQQWGVHKEISSASSGFSFRASAGHSVQPTPRPKREGIFGGDGVQMCCGLWSDDRGTIIGNGRGHPNREAAGRPAYVITGAHSSAMELRLALKAPGRVFVSFSAISTR